ncbi:hypothetical protein CRENBAI_011753 [Crenichthys baileyi]|uniref:Uncharacterized protein n=1 Tax=Crenichthys baileyi TaxID=28760 RepID=A0AAV9RYP9_9TELE
MPHPGPYPGLNDVLMWTGGHVTSSGPHVAPTGEGTSADDLMMTVLSSMQTSRMEQQLGQDDQPGFDQSETLRATDRAKKAENVLEVGLRRSNQPANSSINASVPRNTQNAMTRSVKQKLYQRNMFLELV